MGTAMTIMLLKSSVPFCPMESPDIEGCVTFMIASGHMKASLVPSSFSPIQRLDVQRSLTFDQFYKQHHKHSLTFLVLAIEIYHQGRGKVAFRQISLINTIMSDNMYISRILVKIHDHQTYKLAFIRSVQTHSCH